MVHCENGGFGDDNEDEEDDDENDGFWKEVDLRNPFRWQW